MIKSLLIWLILLSSNADAAPPRSQIAGFVAGDTRCFAGNARPDFSEADARAIDAAIPCANFVESGAGGAFGSLNDFNAGDRTRHVLYLELLRQQKAELDCKAKSLADLTFPAHAGRQQLADKSREMLLKLRGEILRLKNLAAQKLTESHAYAGRRVDGGDPTTVARLKGESAAATADLRTLLARLPLGSEPEIQAAYVRLAVAMPQDGSSQDGRILFESAFTNALGAASKKYTNARVQLDGLFSGANIGRTGYGDSREDENLWRAFGAAGSFENFAQSLRLNTRTQKEISCSLDAQYRRGPQLLQTADTVINLTGLGAAVVTAVFPPAAVVTAPVMTMTSMYQALGAVYYVDQAVQECSSPSTQYSIVTGNQCIGGQTLAAKELVRSEQSSCGGAVVAALMNVGGVALEIGVGTRLALRTGDGLAADLRASGELPNEVPPPRLVEEGGATVVNDIIVTPAPQRFDLSKLTTKLKNAVRANPNFRRILADIPPSEQDDAVSILTLLKNQNNPPLSDAEVANKFKRLVETGTCAVGGR